MAGLLEMVPLAKVYVVEVFAFDTMMVSAVVKLVDEMGSGLKLVTLGTKIVEVTSSVVPNNDADPAMPMLFAELFGPTSFRVTVAVSGTVKKSALSTTVPVVVY